MYKFVGKLLGNEMAFKSLVFYLKLLNNIPGSRHVIKLFHPLRSSLSRKAFGINFPGPVGIGPGIDRNGLLYDIIGAYGYSYIEIGPMDPESVRKAIKHMRENKPDVIISCCINKEHLQAFSLSYDFVDMFVLDILDGDTLNILDAILNARLTYDTYKPVLLRLTHPADNTDEILDYCIMNGVDGFVASGCSLVRHIFEFSKGRIPIIGYGNITDASQAREMLEAGASLVEITRGFIDMGPALAYKIQKHL